MASPEDLHLPLLDTSVPCDVSCNESYNEISSPLTTIVLIPNSTSHIPIIPSLEPMDEITNEDEFGQPLKKSPRSIRKISMASVSHRLYRRKMLHNRLYTINNIMCFLGFLGIILMIIENELTFMNVYDKKTNHSWFIKIIITITTIILVGLVFYYNRLSLSLYAINNSLDNWRVGLTYRKIFLIFFEAFICAIHPIPQYFPFKWNIQHDNSTISYFIPPPYIDMNVALGLPMFARIYLICRFIMFHSHLVYNASSQSLGYLNQVSINFVFLIKTYVEQWPARCLLIFCTFLFLIGSWSLRACNYSSTSAHMSMLDSMWLFIVTFTTVGYGDLTPSTYCGRSVAAITGLIGIFSTALLISVLAQKLKLTRSEKYVHNFVLNIKLAKECKNQAANVIKSALKLWYLKRKHRPTSTEYIKAQRRLFRSIHFNQQLKQKQKQLIDNCIGFPELITIQREANIKIQGNTDQLMIMNFKVDKIEEKLVHINQTMINIQNTLNLLLNRVS